MEGPVKGDVELGRTTTMTLVDIPEEIIPIVRHSAAVWGVSLDPEAPRQRYRAAIVMSVCDHKHRSLQAAARCSFSHVIKFQRHLEEVKSRGE